MREEKIANTLLYVLGSQFNIEANTFQWDTTLAELNRDFIWLGVLTDLEKAINEAFSIAIPLIEHIDASIHTPKDVVQLITAQIDLAKD